MARSDRKVGDLKWHSDLLVRTDWPFTTNIAKINFNERTMRFEVSKWHPLLRAFSRALDDPTFETADEARRYAEVTYQLTRSDQ